MWELDHKEGWELKSWCFWTVVLEKTLESPLDCKEIQPVHLKGDQSWMFIGRMDAKAEVPILWLPDEKSWLIGKDPDAGKDWGQEEKGTAEDEVVGWHHWLSGHELQQTLGDDEGKGSMVCWGPWGCKESDTTEWLNNNKSMENCRSPYSLGAALMSKLKCSYWDSSAFSLILLWMKNNACPPPPSDNGQGEPWAEKRERWKGRPGKGREEPVSQLLDQTCSVGCCHHQSAGRRARGQTSFK